MRDIKFRGKRTETDEWVYGLLYTLKGEADLRQNTFTGFETKKVNIDRVYIVGSTLPDIVGWDLRGTMFFYEVHKESVGQYVGLKDKNGKEIYEGDILQSASRRDIYSVIWKHSGWFRSPIKGNWRTTSLFVQYKNQTIIGNVFQNPDLIKGGQ